MELSPGAEVDRYVVEELLGRGGMATVYRVRHRELGGEFALKVLDVPSRSVRERLRAEGSFQSTLRHPNVVSVIDVITLDGAPALVLEFVDGPTLEQLLAVHRPSLPQIDGLAEGLLLGVRAAHRHGLVHRDLKPANVLLQRTDDGFVPKVTDFGLARVIGGEGSGPGLVQTRSGAVLGTPAYMAPEQFRSSDVDVRADVWSLGVTLYELCTGQRPYEARDLFELADRVRAGGFRPPRELVPELPERMERAILGALRPDPAERFSDVDALRAAWSGRAEAPHDGRSPWDRALLDSMSRSGGGSSADRSGPRGGRASSPQTWVSGASLAGADRSSARPPSFARRSAPLVAVAGLVLVMMLGVGVVGGGGWLAARSGGRAPASAEPAVDAPSRPAPAPAPAGAPAEDAVPDPATPADRMPPLGDLEKDKKMDRRGQVVVRGDRLGSVSFASADGKTYPPGPLEPGEYTVRAIFADGSTADPPLVFTVDDTRLIVTCSWATHRCAVEPD